MNKIFFIPVIFSLCTVRLSAFIDFSLGINAGVPVSILPEPMMIALPFIETESKNNSDTGLNGGFLIGSELDITARIPGNIAAISFENSLGISNTLLNYYENSFEKSSLYYRIGFTVENMIYFKLSPILRDVRKEAFFFGTGSGSDTYQFAHFISGDNENLIFSPATVNYAAVAAGYEKLIRRGNPKSTSYHRYALKLKPRIFAAIGFNRNDTSVKFNIDKKMIVIKKSELTTAGYPELKVGFDVSITANFDLETVKKDYAIKLSKESTLIFQPESFSASLLQGKKVKVSVQNKNIYSTYYSDDIVLEKDEFERSAAGYIARHITNETGFIHNDTEYDYEILITLNKLDVVKSRGMNLVTHSLETSVYVFEKYTDLTGLVQHKIVMEGVMQAGNQMKIPAGYKGSISALIKTRKESLSVLLEETARIFTRDFITPDTVYSAQLKHRTQ